MSDVPPGFVALEKTGPFIGLIGPLYLPADRSVKNLVAMRAEEKHLNMRGALHGGALAALVDTAFGIVLRHACDVRTITVSLTTDFLEPVKAGDWIEAHIEATRVGKRLVFAQGMLKVGARNVLRASGVFAIVPPAAK